MNVLKVPIHHAEKIRQLLAKNSFIDYNYCIEKNKSHIFFPLSDFFIKTAHFPIINRTPEKKESQKPLKESLKKKLKKSEFEKLKTSYDIIGSIAILEIDKELEKKAKIIAEALLQSNKNIKTVLQKHGAHTGEFRTQKMKFLAGKNTKEAIHKENGILLKLNVESVYFSPRLSSERKRIASLVKPNESVLVMFSGCAPYPCVIGKNTKAKEIYGIEINSAGHKYAQENIRLNNFHNIHLFLGDVKKVIPALKKKFDRILMPLPKSAENFLDTALSAAKKGAIIHFYNFVKEEEFPKFKKLIQDACKKNKKKCKILRIVKCGQNKPHVFRICIDFKIL